MQIHESRILNPMIISRTPYRISFFGGGTDYPSWYRKHGGQVLSSTIDKYIYISCRYLPPFFEHRIRLVYSKVEACSHIDEIQHPAVREILKAYQVSTGVEIHYDGDLPARSGMGSSSAFSVGLINAVSAYAGLSRSKEQLAKEAINIEQNVLKEQVGSQDQVNAAYGGLNHIHFQEDGGLGIQEVTVSEGRKQELRENLMLFYTGIMRTAETVASSYLNDLTAQEQRLIRMEKFVDEAIDIVTGQGDLANFGRLLHETWMEKRSLSSLVSNPQVDEIYAAARSAGALGGKLTGAGGGGMMLLFVPKKYQRQVRKALSRLLYIPFKFSSTGSEVIFRDEQTRYDEAISRPADLKKFVEVDELEGS